MLRTMERFKRRLAIWNKCCFGNIFGRKQKCMTCLNGIQQARGRCDNNFLNSLENKLLTKMDQILTQEENLWKQKSWIFWLLEGERNTRFFHLSTLIRRRRNRITRLQDDLGILWDDDVKLQEMACSF